MPKRLNFRQRMLRYPPVLVRLLTVRGDRWHRWVPTDRQLVESSGLTMAEVKFIGYSLTWDEVSERRRYLFMRACDIDLEETRCFRRLEWMRVHGGFSHLRKSDQWPEYLERLEIWEEHKQNQ